MWEFDYKESWAPKNWCFWTVVQRSWRRLENPLDCKEIQPVHPKGDQSWVFIGRTYVEWNSNTLATWWEELTHLKRPWCWERLKAGGEGDDRGWDGQMASLTQWTWVWVNSRSQWWTGRLGVLQSMGSQRVRHDWETELNWTTRPPGNSLVCSTVCLSYCLFCFFYISEAPNPVLEHCLWLRNAPGVEQMQIPRFGTRTVRLRLQEITVGSPRARTQVFWSLVWSTSEHQGPDQFAIMTLNFSHTAVKFLLLVVDFFLIG